MAKKNTTSRKSKSKARKDVLERINPNAARIDIGANFHLVAIPENRTEENVRKFCPFTSDLHRLADWLSEHRIETVVMESTGVYWIPVFQILEQRGFEVKLVNATHVKNLPGRKSDVSDCQWLKTKNRAAAMFRLAAQGAMQSKTAVGAFIRRLRARLGAPKAINAGANKLARLFYRMLMFGAAYVEQGQTYYEEKYKERLLRNLSKRAKEFGFQLTPFQPATVSVS
jgi:hypothetical protein